MVDKIVSLYQEGKVRSEIAFQVGVSSSAVDRYIRKALGSQKKVKKHSEEDLQDWQEFYQLGFSNKEIAEAYEVAVGSVKHHTDRIGVENKSAGRPPKYPVELIAEWNVLKDRGNTYKAISAEYNVPVPTVKNCITRYRQERTINPKPKNRSVKDEQ
jgi:transposase